ncbi:unnamed protein product [Brachionus calyciflorus]|uniref:Uncharacterized protein n=1 Tax=Brachionus calyciflorus TaxID=104777 RepID=A0A814JM95_9BILA|nr:unnamed protein product [Brachionus calyciflorus]
MNDNVVASNKLIVFYEEIKDSGSKGLEHPSVVFNLMSYDLLNPIVKMLAKSDSVKSSRNFVNRNQPCDLRLVNLRTMEGSNEEPLKKEVGLIVHRIPYDDCSTGNSVELSEYFKSECANSASVKFQDLFVETNDFKVKQAYLSLSEKNSEFIKRDSLIYNFVQPMQIEAFRLQF